MISTEQPVTCTVFYRLSETILEHFRAVTKMIEFIHSVNNRQPYHTNTTYSMCPCTCLHFLKSQGGGNECHGSHLLGKG